MPTDAESWTDESLLTFNRWQAYINEMATAFDESNTFWRNVHVTLFCALLSVNFLSLLAQLLQVSSPQGSCYLGQQEACQAFYYLSIACTLLMFVLNNVQQFLGAEQKKRGCSDAKKDLRDLALTINKYLCMHKDDLPNMTIVYELIQQRFKAIVDEAPPIYPWYRGNRYLPLPQRNEHKGIRRQDLEKWQQEVTAARDRFNRNVSETIPAPPAVAAAVGSEDSLEIHQPPEFGA
jgi:hypothetical protein